MEEARKMAEPWMSLLGDPGEKMVSLCLQEHLFLLFLQSLEVLHALVKWLQVEILMPVASWQQRSVCTGPGPQHRVATLEKLQ